MVLFPDPVGPVTVISPRGVSAILRKTSPIPGSSIVSTFEGMVRKTPPAQRFWSNAFTRNRATPGPSKKVTLKELLVVFALLVVHDLRDQGVNFLMIQRRQVDSPDISVQRIIGGRPA